MLAKEIIKDSIKSILNSYSQIFFSNNWGFALLLIAVTFFDVNAGVGGLLAVIISNGLAYIMGFSRYNIKCGYYGFNSLLVGLGLGIYYNPNLEFFIVLFFAILLTLLITVMLEGVIGKYGLPFLSVPFLFGIWMVTLASRQFKALEISDRGIYTINEIYTYGGIKLVAVYEWFNKMNLPESLIIYFKSLGAIFFQYNVLAGVLIAIGILFCSRIAFTLTIIGFYSAYIYYHLIGANITELSYGYIGFNYILTAIAIGGIFIVPSKYSYLWVILLTPLISILITSSIAIFSILQLSVLSLPFNIIVLLFLYVLKFRKTNFSFPELVAVQQNSPEKNVYHQHNNKQRFVGLFKFPFSLPFNDEWHVSQGYDGEHTHKDDWKHALDFLIRDNENKTYKGIGNVKENYYCYKKPVTAPADGWIEDVIDNIPDNEITDVNLEDNWGNTIIIRHANQLFTQISHLMKGSIKVAKGSFVKKGEVIASCGNSGRSPEPHVHFQVQATPFVGSKTLGYPISHFMLKNNSAYELKSYDYPKKDNIISNIEQNPSIFKAFHFIPGQKLNFEIEFYGNKEIVEWEIVTDIYNDS
ncbi:MAG: urea transporter, partial [Bacteroidales bacterium]|nr:urea transporter [Bacteroidales bacterium]